MLQQQQVMPKDMLDTKLHEAEESLEMLEHYLASQARERRLACFYYSVSDCSMQLNKLRECLEVGSHSPVHQRRLSRLTQRFSEHFREFVQASQPIMVLPWFMQRLSEQSAIREIQRSIQTLGPIHHESNDGREKAATLAIRRHPSEVTTDYRVATPVDFGKHELPVHSLVTPKAKPKQEGTTPSTLQTAGKSDEQHFAEKYEQCLRDYTNHIMDVAYSGSIVALELLERIDPQKRRYATEHAKLLQIGFEHSEMLRYCSHFEQEEWQFDKSENGVSLYYRMYEAEKQISVLIESELAIPVQNFMAMLCEMDLFENYVPFCYDCSEQKRISRNEAIGHSKVNVPLLTDRQTYFYAVGYDRLKHNGSLFFYSKTINEDFRYQQKYGFDVPPKSDKYVRLQYNFFIVEYRPLKDNLAKVRIASNVDLRMNFLPNWILSFSARKFAFTYFVNIMDKQRKFEKSAWAQKIRENPQLYDFFRQKIVNFLHR